MVRKLIWFLAAALLLSSAAAEGPVFAGVSSNVSLDVPSAGSYLVVDDDEDELFDSADSLTPIDRSCDLTITMGGDAVVGIREIWWKRDDALPAYLAKYGMAYPFGGLQAIFAADDLTYINLECTLKGDANGEVKDKEYRFRGLPEYTQVLTSSSVELLNIANNHYVDYREGGQTATRQALDAAGLPYSGYGYAYIWEMNGWRIGFAGCRETEFKLDPEIISREAQSLRAYGCDVVIYACHWGREYTTKHNEYQELMAQAAADAGVDIIVGTHPHVVQGIGTVDGTVALWSLGNLMFGGTINMQTFDAALAQVTLHFDQSGYTGCTVQYVPILTSSVADTGVNDYHPVPAEGKDYDRIMDKIQFDSDRNVREPMDFPARQH